MSAYEFTLLFRLSVVQTGNWTNRLKSQVNDENIEITVQKPEGCQGRF